MKPQHQQQQLPFTAASLSHLPTMESLALPQELYWDGKSEPNSPPSSELFTIATDLVETENWLYDDNLENEILLLSDEDLELKPGVEILCNLIDGDEYVVELDSLKDENWPPQTAGITNPIAAYSELDSLVAPAAPQQNFFTKPFDEVIYNESIQNAGTLTTLTPPQSPPRNGNLLALQEPQQLVNAPIQFHTLHYRPTAAAAVPVAQQVATPATNTYIVPQSVSTELQSNSNANANNAAQFTDNAAAAAAYKVKNEYEHAQIIDQIVEEFAKDLPDLSDEYESQYTYSPPSQIEESSIDEEWTPTNSAGSSPAHCSGSSSSCSGDDEKLAEGTTPTKKRRPYGRGVEDRKIRKKEQNKNAATRYRQKKKMEMEKVLTEEQILTKRNEELQGKLQKFDHEMKYLKGLIREFYRKNKSVWTRACLSLFLFEVGWRSASLKYISFSSINIETISNLQKVLIVKFYLNVVIVILSSSLAFLF